MAEIVWDRKNKVKYPANGVFANATEANAWIRRNATRSGHKQNDQVTYDVITVSVQA